MSVKHRELSGDELIRHITIMMAATNQNPPILRGKASQRDPWQRDRFRHEFAEWIVDVCFERCGLQVVGTRGAMQGNDMASFRVPATPPQRSAN